jgi:hypothetical protein
VGNIDYGDEMLKVYSCIVNAHDLQLVGLAALICAVASFAAITLLHHVRRSTGHMRGVWLAISAASTGFGIWATHFIAMLAFSPGIPNAYNIALTALSLLAAVILTGAGLAVGVSSISGAAAWLGGAMVGGGIAAMHYQPIDRPCSRTPILRSTVPKKKVGAPIGFSRHRWARRFATVAFWNMICATQSPAEN